MGAWGSWSRVAPIFKVIIRITINIKLIYDNNQNLRDLALVGVGVDVLVDGVHHAVTQGLAHIDQELVCLFVEQLLDHHPSLVVDGLIGMVLVRSMIL